jgi:hypothetical protein
MATSRRTNWNDSATPGRVSAEPPLGRRRAMTPEPDCVLRCVPRSRQRSIGEAGSPDIAGSGASVLACGCDQSDGSVA